YGPSQDGLNLNQGGLMANHKFSALAHQVTEQRLRHLRSLKPEPLRPEDHYYLRVSDDEDAGRQLRLGFQNQAKYLEVFQRFDPHRREVEWSYYTPAGKFLLQFAFDLKDLSFWIHSIHPALLQPASPMAPYLKAVNHHLAGRYPALQLLRDAKGEPAIKPLASPAAPRQ
ncbi:MAG: hypothetical protein ACREP8_14695, partial [Candidatus Binatia bacterium]